MSLYTSVCDECDERTGQSGNGKCNACHGNGWTNLFDINETCERCGGDGECPRCNGNGYVDD